MDSTSLMFLVCAAVGALALAYKVRDLRRAPRQALHLVISVMMIFVVAVMVASAPITARTITSWSGVPNLAHLIKYSLIVGEVTTAVALISCWQQPWEQALATIRRWAGSYALALMTMAALFTAGDAHVDRVIDFDTYYVSTPYIREMILLFIAIHTAAGIVCGVFAWRWAAVAGRPWLRRGLRTCVAGAVFGLGYDACKIIAIIARWTGGDLDHLSTTAAAHLGGIGTMLLAIGYVLPLIGPRASGLAARVARIRAYRRLHPLWDALRRSFPHIVPALAIPWWDLELRIARRLTEICDGRLALRPYIDSEVVRTAQRIGAERGLDDFATRALVEAVSCRAGIAAKAANQTYTTGDTPFVPTHGSDGGSELAWWVAVSDAFVNSPLVAAALSAPEPSSPN